MSLTNVYHLRRVADTSAKACLICFKPSTSVLITPDNKDRHFCSPIVDNEGEAARLKEEAMAKEIENVKKEYEEKQQRKKEREKQSAKDDKDKEKDAEKEKNQEGSKDKDKTSDITDEKERDEKIDSIRKGGTQSKSDNSHRVFALHKTFYQMRIDRLRGIEMAKRNQERMKNPSLFPSVPTRDL